MHGILQPLCKAKGTVVKVLDGLWAWFETITSLGGDLPARGRERERVLIEPFMTVSRARYYLTGSTRKATLGISGFPLKNI